MNVNAHYLESVPENINTKNVETETLTTNYIVVNTLDRLHDNESIWNFRIKFGVTGEKITRFPLYQNDSNNTWGISIDGLTYRPYNSSITRGTVIGFGTKTFVGESGCVISERMRHISKIHTVRINIPKPLILHMPYFDNTFLLSCQELSGFSNTCVTDDSDVSFNMTLIETTHTSFIYTTHAHMNFKSPLNLHSLTLKLSNKMYTLEDLDTVHICKVRINNKGYLEIVADTVPTTFETYQSIVLSNITLTSEITQNNESYENTCSVIDGYIKNSKVVYRTLDGKHICDSTSDIHGTCFMNVHKKHKVILAIANGGIDISYNKENILEFRSLYIYGTQKHTNITPLTSLVADYIIYTQRNHSLITHEYVQKIHTEFARLLNISSMCIDYISCNDIQIGILAYRIVTLIKATEVLLQTYVKSYHKHSSYICTHLSLYIYNKSFTHTSFSDVHSISTFIDSLVKNNTSNTYIKARNTVAHALVCHNSFNEAEVDFEVIEKHY